ncbi:MAG TPA: (d)CMP kinase [Polyangiaceae bacterium]|nr:(d)CMP kinase [Polyangiaceae bacterium]
MDERIDLPAPGSPRPLPIIAIDGPAGAGKSTVAKRLADSLGFILVDTGAMYRVVALAARSAGVSWDDDAALGRLARGLVARGALSFERDARLGVRAVLDGADVTDAIRAPDVGMGASAVSAHPSVRDALLDFQRHAGRRGGVVLEGRDIGTVVFPDAEIKFFLTARPEVRARRRFDELVARGTPASFEQTLRDVRQRDLQDTTRPVAPLRQAADAILVDSSEMNIEETVAHMAESVRKRGAR